MYKIVFPKNLDARKDAMRLILKAVSQFLDKKYPGVSIKISDINVDFEKGEATFEAEPTQLAIAGKLFDEKGNTLYQPSRRIR